MPHQLRAFASIFSSKLNQWATPWSGLCWDVSRFVCTIESGSELRCVQEVVVLGLCVNAFVHAMFSCPALHLGAMGAGLCVFQGVGVAQL